MNHPLTSLYQQLSDLLEKEADALNRSDERLLPSLARSIYSCWQSIEVYKNAMPAGLSDQERFQLISLLSRLRTQVEKSRKSWLDYQNSLKQEQATMTSARRYIAETKQKQATIGPRFSRSV